MGTVSEALKKLKNNSIDLIVASPRSTTHSTFSRYSFAVDRASVKEVLLILRTPPPTSACMLILKSKDYRLN